MKKYSIILSAAIMCMAAFASSAIVFASAPANDNLVNAQNVAFIGTTPTTINSNNIGATHEVGEPNHFNSNDPGAKSVWYKWTPTSSFSTQLRLTNDFYSIIAVYRSSVASPGFADLVHVTASTESGFDYDSMSLRFFAKQGTTYYIAVDCNKPSNVVTEGPFQLEFLRAKFRYSTIFGSDDDPANLVVYRPSQGTWYSLSYWTAGTPNYNNWGLSADTPIPADYDGSGDADLAITRNVGGLKYWWINPQTGSLSVIVNQWGLDTDKAITGDFDRDGVADLAVTRKTLNGLVWFIRQSSLSGQTRIINFGLNTDSPVIGDFDGDGATDIAIVRSIGGKLVWYVLRSGFLEAGQTYTKFDVMQFGITGDIQTAEDFDGDGKTDIAIFRPAEGKWYVIRSSTGQLQVMQFGQAGDRPQPADFDGDGKTDIGVFRPSTGTWYLSLSRENKVYIRNWGVSSDVLVTSLNSLLNSQ